MKVLEKVRKVIGPPESSAKIIGKFSLKSQTSPIQIPPGADHSFDILYDFVDDDDPFVAYVTNVTFPDDGQRSFSITHGDEKHVYVLEVPKTDRADKKTTVILGMRNMIEQLENRNDTTCDKIVDDYIRAIKQIDNDGGYSGIENEDLASSVNSFIEGNLDAMNEWLA